MTKPLQDGVETAIRKAQKAEKDRHQAMKVLPQITAFVKAKIPLLVEEMRHEEARTPDLRRYMISWQFIGKRPKIRDAWQFILMMEKSLIDQLTAEGCLNVKVTGWTYNTSFDIIWERPLN